MNSLHGLPRGIFLPIFLFCINLFWPVFAEVTPSNPSTGTAPAPTQALEPKDLGAEKFMMSCAGCHTIGKGKLTGPDLAPSSKWVSADLKSAIKRMEKSTGPLSDEEVTALIDFLKDTRFPERLAAQEARIAQMFASKMDPASAETGKGLFEGKLPLKNGGLACTACHPSGVSGGLLGPDLSDIHTRMGEIPLISAIEKSSYKIMTATYRDHPITKQEAMHLAKYLRETGIKSTGSLIKDAWWFGLISSALVLTVLTLLYRPARGVTHQPLKKRRN